MLGMALKANRANESLEYAANCNRMFSSQPIRKPAITRTAKMASETAKHSAGLLRNAVRNTILE